VELPIYEQTIIHLYKRSESCYNVKC